MPNNKERLNDLEVGLRLMQESLNTVQEEMQKWNAGIDGKLQWMETSFRRMLEETVNQMRELIVVSRESSSSMNQRYRRTEEQQYKMNQRSENTNPFAVTPTQGHARQVKLEFPRFNGGDPEEWLNRAKQYFVYHEIPQEQRVSFASYHLTEEANAWWQAKLRGRGFDAQRLPWETFEAEL